LVEEPYSLRQLTHCRSEHGGGANKPCNGLSARLAACRHTSLRFPHAWPPVTFFVSQPVTELREATRQTRSIRRWSAIAILTGSVTLSSLQQVETMLITAENWVLPRIAC
jgi:hypothetical protein